MKGMCMNPYTWRILHHISLDLRLKVYGEQCGRMTSIIYIPKTRTLINNSQQKCLSIEALIPINIVDLSAKGHVHLFKFIRSLE